MQYSYALRLPNFLAPFLTLCLLVGYRLCTEQQFAFSTINGALKIVNDSLNRRNKPTQLMREPQLPKCGFTALLNAYCCKKRRKKWKKDIPTEIVHQIGCHPFRYSKFVNWLSKLCTLYKCLKHFHAGI